MKRFLSLTLLILSFLSVTCYGDVEEAQTAMSSPEQQVVYDLIVCEELLNQAQDHHEIVLSSALINEFDQAFQDFSNNYSQLQADQKNNLIGVMQYMLSSGLMECMGSNCYPAYKNQGFLEVLLGGLVNNPNQFLGLVDAMNEYIIENQQSIYPDSGSASSEDLTTLNTLYACLTELSLSPTLIQDNAFAAKLYQAFSNAGQLFSNYTQSLMLFEMDLVGSNLYSYQSNVLPPTNIYPTFDNATEMQTAMTGLLTGPNELFFNHMNGHLQMGINSLGGGY